MPELPEVENVIRSLAVKITGKKIWSVEVLTQSIIYHRKDFKEVLEGRTIEKLDRRGKYIIVRLDRGNLLVHLRMTGKLLFNGEINKHTHLIIDFEEDGMLVYNDVRKFGRVSLLSNEELSAYLETKVGLEPGLMSFEEFRNKLSKKKGPLKKILLDQSNIAGIGNIYADEILFASGIHPLEETSRLNEEDYKILYDNIRRILEEAIVAGGSTIRDYVDGDGKAGGFQDCHMVYGRGGCHCNDCGCTLEKIKVTGRTTVYCPVCQGSR